MTKFREQRGSYLDSMQTVKPCESLAQLKKLCAELAPPAALANLRVRFYRYDARNGWNTHIVDIQDYGVLGFTDGPLPLEGR